MRKVLMFLLLIITVIGLASCDSLLGGVNNNQNNGDQNNDGVNTEGKIKILLTHDSGVSVVGDNPVYIEEGEDAVFNLEFAPTSSFESTSHGIYKDSCLTVSGITRDTVVKLTSVDLGYDTTAVYRFMFFANDGDTSTVKTGGKANAGTEVTVSANDKFKIFIGWSLDGYTTDKSKIISDARSFTFRLDPDMPDKSGVVSLYANYADLGSYYYDANGGTINTGTALTKANDYYNLSNSTNRLKVNISSDYLDVAESVCLFYDDGTFTKDGYVLAEFNTKPDGSGEGYSLGSKFYISPTSSELPVLYCIWKKASPVSQFTYESVSYPYPAKETNLPHWHKDGILITSYNGDDNVVTVPEKIDGKYVIGIASGAFVGKTMDTLVLPRSIQKIEQGAFQRCRTLETLYYPDSVYDASNESFDSETTASIRNFRLNATMAPRYANSDGGAFAVKLSRILASMDKNRIIVMAGSSTYQGLSSAYMEALFRNTYRIVNFGTTRTTNCTIYLEAMQHLTHSGDIIIYAPENSTYMVGETELYWKTVKDLEGMYNIYRMVDISKYSNLFSALSDFNQNYRYKRAPERFEDFVSHIKNRGSINLYGEYQNPKRVSLVDNYVDAYYITMNNRYKSKYDGQWDDTAAQESNKDYTDPNNKTWESIDEEPLLSAMNRAISVAKRGGAKVCFSFSPADADKLVSAAKNKEWIAAYDKLVSDIYEYDAVIGSAKDYIYAHEYFYDCAFHLNDVGRTYRTYQLYVDICKFIKMSPRPFASVGTDFEGCIFYETVGGEKVYSRDGKPLISVDYLK